MSGKESEQTGIRKIDTERMDWMPLGPGAWYKPLRFHQDGSGWISLVRIAPGGRVPKHEHHGPVLGYNLQGTGRFLESDVVTTPGTFTYEPAGTVDTLLAEGNEDLVILFVVQDAIAFLDDEGNVRRVETVQSKLSSYESALRADDISPQKLTY